MRIVFMGTPDYAVPSLQKLIDEKYDVAAVFTQPDKKVGRKQILTPTPVKKTALDNGLKVCQPVTLKDGEAEEILNQIAPDAVVVAAYGKILPKSILSIPKYGCINVHASLLPKYRGAAPIQRAVLNGEKETGITIMQMDEGIDTGDILYTVSTEIGVNETSEQLFERLAALGADALITALRLVDAGEIKAEKQTGDSSYAHMIDKTLCPIDWSRPAYEIHNKIRGLQTWPCAETLIGGKRVRIHASLLCGGRAAQPGEVVSASGELVVSCGDGHCVSITKLQPDGKKIMDIQSYLAGNTIKEGMILGV